jgi:hypothetical protein
MGKTDFTFVGYLIQEPYSRGWPLRDGFRVASIEREIHPAYDKHQWNTVEGVQNPTKFLTEFPNLEKLSLEPHHCQSVLHRKSPGWVISGYSFPYEVAGQMTMTSTDGTETLRVFEYAFHMHRNADGLKLLGYEVVDAEIGFPFLSILNNCGYKAEQVHEMSGALNEYSLLSSPEEADRFIEAIRVDPKKPKIVPDHNKGIAVQVWGTP